MSSCQEDVAALQSREDGGGLPGGPVVRTRHSHCRIPGLIPGWGTKIPQATRCGQKKKKRERQRKDGSLEEGGKSVKGGWIGDTCGMWGRFLGNHKTSASTSSHRCPVHVMGLRPWPFSSCESLSQVAQFPHLENGPNHSPYLIKRL